MQVTPTLDEQCYDVPISSFVLYPWYIWCPNTAKESAPNTEFQILIWIATVTLMRYHREIQLRNANIGKAFPQLSASLTDTLDTPDFAARRTDFQTHLLEPQVPDLYFGLRCLKLPTERKLGACSLELTSIHTSFFTQYHHLYQ